jgi:predicted GH43/DUF377 family glycosyl hydrolase
MRAKSSQQLHGVGFDFVRSFPLNAKADERRTILLPFVHSHPQQIREVLEFVRDLSQEDFRQEWDGVCGVFKKRHTHFAERLSAHYEIARHIGGVELPTQDRQILAGAFFTMEYAYQAAALFNPSLVAHPDQTNLSEGAIRFIMSLRAVGEGHISSVVFRTGVIDRKNYLVMDPYSEQNSPSRATPDRQYNRQIFLRTLLEMGGDASWSQRLLMMMPEAFTLRDLENTIDVIRNDSRINDLTATAQTTLDAALWVARSNYQIQLAPEAPISDLLLFPNSESESRGIEDMRLVKFSDNGHSTYFGTYTAFNGSRMLPMLMETRDFRILSIHTLNGKCAQNKGMALFPRKINGRYAMCSRIDGRNLYLMYSDVVHFWENADVLMKPKMAWEYRVMGNCGSPLETPEGWLLITHGVGPMREYCIGATLLDLENPSQIRGRLREPLLVATDETRSGYVPNVVYSCGAMLWNDHVFLPYGIADERTSLATIELQPLLDQLIRDGA